MSPVAVNNILFLDIETVSQYPTYTQLPDNWRQLWDTKSTTLMKYHEGSTNESLYPRAAIYAEFGKIICISCGVLQGSGRERKIVIKSFCGSNEAQVLQQFSDMLNKWTTGEQKYLCAHNGREFDFPYLCRRMIIHRLPLPSILNIAGKKPWEVCHLDTLELWKFGDFKNYTSLNLLAHTLGINTPKDDIDGSMVGQVYWETADTENGSGLKRIVTYCQKDVVAVAQVYLRMHGEELIGEENIEIKS
jgi:uncharacterized protein YprB with RNaseH-like and TPR domain